MNKENIKSLIRKMTFIMLIITGAILLILGILKVSNAVRIKYNTNLILEYGDIAYVSDFVKVTNGKLIDKKIEYHDIGKLKVEYAIYNKYNKKLIKKFTLNIVDNKAPSVILKEQITLVKNEVDDLNSKIFCADNFDKNPKCNIIGNYDLNSVGLYNLQFVAEDSNGNKITKNFELNIVDETKNLNNKPNNFNEVINDYKSNNSKVGIDVSKWQGNIDWKKLKQAGVEFAMIRVGTQGGFGKDNYIDKEFTNNINGALEHNIPVGLYFFSYATTKKEAIDQANWVLAQIKDYKINLPIVFDWESWNKFEQLNLNLYEITQVQEAFLNQIKNKGYKTARYGSKNYLISAWQETEHLTWLAHYTAQTNYEGKYFMWQICNNGIVDGINGYVDIDIMY